MIPYMTVGTINELHLQEVPEQEETHSPTDQAGTSKPNTEEERHRQYGCYQIINLTCIPACILTLNA